MQNAYSITLMVEKILRDTRRLPQRKAKRSMSNRKPLSSKHVISKSVKRKAPVNTVRKTKMPQAVLPKNQHEAFYCHICQEDVHSEG